MNLKKKISSAILFFINVTKRYNTLQWQVACDAVRPNYYWNESMQFFSCTIWERPSKNNKPHMGLAALEIKVGFEWHNNAVGCTQVGRFALRVFFARLARRWFEGSRCRELTFNFFRIASDPIHCMF